MHRLIVYAGPDGSGKSTIRDLAGDPIDVTIDPDRIARELGAAGQPVPDVEAGREAIRRFRAAIAAGASVSLESTLTGNTVLARMRAARHAGYTVSLFYVALATSEDNIARVAARVANGGHDIPEAVIRRRVAASQDNLPAALAIAHFAKVHDNSNREIEKLLEVAHHRIVFEVPDPPEWLATRLAAIRAALAALA